MHRQRALYYVGRVRGGKRKASAWCLSVRLSVSSLFCNVSAVLTLELSQRTFRPFCPRTSTLGAYTRSVTAQTVSVMTSTRLGASSVAAVDMKVILTIERRRIANWCLP